jgi:hypothetical protein
VASNVLRGHRRRFVKPSQLGDLVLVDGRARLEGRTRQVDAILVGSSSRDIRLHADALVPSHHGHNRR